jgi:hypothetical protein
VPDETPAAPAAPAAEVSAPTNFFHELNSDLPPSADAAATPEPTTEGTGEPAGSPPTPSPATTGGEPAPALATTPAPAAAPPVTEEKKFKIRGREYTAAELVQRRDLLEDLEKSHEQLPHLQQKYLESLEAQRQVQQPAPQPQPQAPPISAEMLRTAYGPTLEERVKAGFVNADFAELYPETAVSYLYDRDLFSQVAQKVDAIEQFLGYVQAQGVQQNIGATITGALDALQSQGGHFDLLKEPKVREDFTRFILELDPKRGQLTPEFLGGQFVAFNKDILLEAARQADVQAKRERERTGRNAQGGDGGPRPPRPPAPSPTDQHFDFLNEGLPVAAARR